MQNCTGVTGVTSHPCWGLDRWGTVLVLQVLHHNLAGDWIGAGLLVILGVTGVTSQPCWGPARCRTVLVLQVLHHTPAGDWLGAGLYWCYWVLQVLHHAGSGARHVDGRSTSRPRRHRQDGDHQRHGALSGKVRCRLQLLRPDGLQRAWPHLQR